jgi:glycosyltransferase involved in cell wall biosynthesis
MKVLIALEGKLNQGPNIETSLLIKELSKKNNDTSRDQVKLVETTNLKSLISTIWHLKKFDVFHFYSESPGAAFLFLLFKFLGKKTVYTNHGNIFIEAKEKRWPINLLWVPAHLFVFKNVDAVIFPTRYIQIQINRYLEIKKNTKLTNEYVIPNGIYIEDYPEKLIIEKSKKIKEIQNGQTSLHILLITSFVFAPKTRGVDLLMEVNSILNMKGIKTELRIGGIGPKLNLYKEKYETEKVKFLGYCDNKRENEWADIYIHLSFLDNLPLVILNAGAMGIPTIASNIGGIPEIYGSSSDKIIWGLTSNTPEIITQNILKLIQSHDFYYEVSQQQYQNIKNHFNIEKISNQYWNLYFNL